MTRSLLLAAALLSAACTTTGSAGIASPTPAPAAETHVDGVWNWVCCNGKFRGTMTIHQTGATLAGSIDGFPQDGEFAIRGDVDGTLVHLTRPLPVGGQEFHLIVDSTGKAMAGPFTGPHDPAFATDFVAQRVGPSGDAFPSR